MPKFAVWQPRPIFVTSTFRDMQAERDSLHAHVFPELRQRLRERFHHLEPIDLRWGVETVETSETEAKELLVLKVCLSEIRRSRPLLHYRSIQSSFLKPQFRCKITLNSING